MTETIRAELTWKDAVGELNRIDAENTRLRAALKSIAGWASDEGPLKGMGPMDVSEHARAALAEAK